MFSIARRPLLSALPVLLLLLPTSAKAHEFWLQPEAFRIAIGEPIGVRVMVGDGFEEGEPYAHNPRHIRYFRAAPEGAGEILGESGDEPAGIFTADLPGLATLIYRSYPSRVTIDSTKFEDYLRSEGLEAIVARRAELGESNRAGREAFSRCAKALVEVEGVAPEGFDEPIGLALEIVPLASPFALPASGELRIQVLWKGEPLSNAQVRVFVSGEPDQTATVQTTQDGTAAIEAAAPGVRLLSVVHMERADEGSAVDWESTWSSLTFEIP